MGEVGDSTRSSWSVGSGICDGSRAGSGTGSEGISIGSSGSGCDLGLVSEKKKYYFVQRRQPYGFFPLTRFSYAGKRTENFRCSKFLLFNISVNKCVLKYAENLVLSIYSLSFLTDNINKDLDFHVRVCAYEKCVSGKQPL